MLRWRSALSLLLFAALAGLAATGCNNNAIGAPCILNANVADGRGGDAGVVLTTAINSTSLDCPSRICLHFPPQAGATDPSEITDFCTALCGSDSDCNPGVGGSPCKHQYRCVTPFLVGGFCCKKMCVCQDRLNLGPDGGVQNEPPTQCKPGNSTCGTM